MRRSLSIFVCLAVLGLLLGAAPLFAGEAPGPAPAPPTGQAAPPPPPAETAPATAPATPPAAESVTAPATVPATPPAAEPVPAAPPVLITSIEVAGAGQIKSDDILAAVSSQMGGVYTEAQVSRDRQAIVDLGWFETVSVERESTEAGVRLVFRVVENPVITDLHFDGATVFKPERLLAVMKLKSGTVFNSRLMYQDSQAITKLYASEGYILATVLGRDMNASGVLTIGVAEGVIEAVRVAGNTHTKEKVIRHYIRTKPGDIYNYRKVAADVARLTNMRWFETVQQTAEVGTQKPGNVVLVITVVEKKRTGTATVGGGYSSSQGIVGYIDLSKENLWGTGRSATVRLEGGGTSSYEIYYRDPWIMTPETRLNAGLYNRLITRDAYVKKSDGTTDTVTYDERRSGGSVTLGRPLSDRTTAYLGLRLDRRKIVDVAEEDAVYLTGTSFQPRNVHSLTPGLTRDHRDNPDYPRHGSFRQLTAELAGGVLGGTSDFNKYSLDTRYYFPITKKSTLAFRLLGGFITGEAPYLEQFLLGGTESLRGYTSDRFVGARMILLNLEYRQPVGRNVVAVAFIDVGDAWGGSVAEDANIDGDLTYTTHLGYGIGVRVATPIGPVRLDLGFSAEGTETHFGVSQMF